MIESGYFKDITQIPQAVVKIMAGQELGLEPFAALKGLDIMEGQIQIRSHTMAAMIKKSGKYRYVVHEMTDKIVRLYFSSVTTMIGLI